MERAPGEPGPRAPAVRTWQTHRGGSTMANNPPVPDLHALALAKAQQQVDVALPRAVAKAQASVAAKPQGGYVQSAASAARWPRLPRVTADATLARGRAAGAPSQAHNSRRHPASATILTQ